MAAKVIAKIFNIGFISRVLVCYSKYTKFCAYLFISGSISADIVVIPNINVALIEVDSAMIIASFL